MVVVAHPDDAEFMVAGSVARWIREGREVIYVLCTNGDKGSSDPELTPDKMARIRREEQQAACAVLGVSELVFLGYPDGHLLKGGMDLRRDIARQIRRFKPDAVVCQDPTQRWYGSSYLNHPDHRAAGDAALDAVFPLARDYHTLPELITEGLLPHKVRHVYISPGLDGHDAWFDITETIEQKIAALFQHKSQVNGAERPNGAEGWLRQMGRALAEGHEVEYAEAFKYIRLD